ncbi:MAG: HEPN domain-containing protein [Verrucomicrobiota bacterium]
MSQNPQTRLLLRKAAADEVLLDRILAAPEVDDELVGFHCQQAAEKCLKAWLCDSGVNYPKTHNLLMLVELLEADGKTLPEGLAAIDHLTPYATIFRYEDPPQSGHFDRPAARQLVRDLRAFVERQLRPE